MGPDEFNIRGAMDEKFWIERVFGVRLTWYHKKWLDALNTHRFICITAFRGSAKSTLLNVFHTIYKVWYGSRDIIIIIANNMKQSNRIMRLIKQEIEDNELLSQLVPSSRLDSWKADMLVTSTKCEIMSLAYNDNLRGNRPNLVICDEFDSYEDLMLWKQVVEPLVDLTKGTIIGTTTPIKPNGLLNELQSNDAYWSMEVPVLNERGESNWPEMFSVEDINLIRKRVGEHSFQTEYMVRKNVQSDSGVYDPSIINECLDINLSFNSNPHKEGIRFLAADFAVASGPRADFDAYLIVEKIKNKIFVKHIEKHRGFRTRQKSERIKLLFDLHKCSGIIIDPSGIGGAVKDELIKMSLPVEEAEMHSIARQGLIIGLKTTFDAGELVIPYSRDDELTKSLVDNLITELLGFKEAKSPSGGTIFKSESSHDDLAISLMMAVKIANSRMEFLDW